MASLPMIPDDEPVDQLSNPQAEFDLLCVLLRERPILESVADRLTGDDFSDAFMGRMYDALVHEASCGREANHLTIRPILEKDPDFQHFGGLAALLEMAGKLSQLYDWQGIAKEIIRLARRRRMIESFQKAIALAEDSTTAEDAMMEAADLAIAEASETGETDNIRSLSECMKTFVDTIDDPVAPGILCKRIEPLDFAMGPIRPGNLVIGAGRPGMGKTATVLSYAIGAAEQGHGVLIVSMEMAADELQERMISDMTFDGHQGVPYEHIRERRLDTYQRRDVARTAIRNQDLPIHIFDTSGMTIPKLDRVIRRFRRRLAAKGQTLDLVIVDYLQLMSGTDRKAGKTAEITEISGGLKRLAKAHGVGMFALSQLSREVEKRPDKRPILSDLRDSGSIEQDADVVVFFFRLEYYLKLNEPDEDSSERFTWQQTYDACAGTIDFICAKKRHGRSNVTRKGRFHGEYQAVR